MHSYVYIHICIHDTRVHDSSGHIPKRSLRAQRAEGFMPPLSWGMAASLGGSLLTARLGAVKAFRFSGGTVNIMESTAC